MVARRTNSALLPRSTDRAWSPGTQTPHCFPAPRSGMVTRRTNSALLPRSTDRAWSPGTQTPHCFPAPRSGMVTRRTNSALLPRSTDRAWPSGTQTAHCSPAPRTEHGRQALKQDIAPLLHGQGMVARHTNKASGVGLRPRRPPDRAWSLGTQTAHCSPAPRTEHGRQALKHRIASPLHGHAWFLGTQTPHCSLASRIEHGSQAHRQRITSAAADALSDIVRPFLARFAIRSPSFLTPSPPLDILPIPGIIIPNDNV